MFLVKFDEQPTPLCFGALLKFKTRRESGLAGFGALQYDRAQLRSQAK